MKSIIATLALSSLANAQKICEDLKCESSGGTCGYNIDWTQRTVCDATSAKPYCKSNTCSVEETLDFTTWKGTKVAGDKDCVDDITQTTSCKVASQYDYWYNQCSWLVGDDDSKKVCISGRRYIGDSCDSNWDCGSQTCTDGRCAGGQAAGKICSNDRHCALDHYCYYDDTTKANTCKKKGASGADCEYDGQCGAGLLCFKNNKCGAAFTEKVGTVVSDSRHCETAVADENDKCVEADWSKVGATCDKNTDCKYPGGDCSCSTNASGNKGYCILEDPIFIMLKEDVVDLGTIKQWVVDAETSCGDIGWGTFDADGDLVNCVYNEPKTKEGAQFLFQYTFDTSKNHVKYAAPGTFTCGGYDASNDFKKPNADYQKIIDDRLEEIEFEQNYSSASRASAGFALVAVALGALRALF